MNAPSPWVTRFITGIRPGAHILDVACGSGRHIALCQNRGLRITGIDRDISSAGDAFNADPTVHLMQHDLEDSSPFPFPPGSFDGVIITNYLWRPLLPQIIATVSASGVLIYETFRLGNERFGKPSNPDFLLQPGELLAAVSGKLHVVAYEDTCLAAPGRVIQRICAAGPRHPWIGMPPTDDANQ
jgi:SAM-dependent methyltransferase